MAHCSGCLGLMRKKTPEHASAHHPRVLQKGHTKGPAEGPPPSPAEGLLSKGLLAACFLKAPLEKGAASSLKNRLPGSLKKELAACLKQAAGKTDGLGRWFRHGPDRVPTGFQQGLDTWSRQGPDMVPTRSPHGPDMIAIPLPPVA